MKAKNVVAFQEKPKEASPMPGEAGHVLASMGIYVFTARLMYELLCQDATKPEHDGTSAKPRRERGRPARYMARRIAWHTMDHAWEIEDRSEK